MTFEVGNRKIEAAKLSILLFPTLSHRAIWPELPALKQHRCEATRTKYQLVGIMPAD
jgi:hypothetical protein